MRAQVSKRMSLLLVSVLLVLASTAAAQDPSLVLYFSLDEDPVDEARDLSLYENHGSVEGGPEWVEAMFGGGLFFDATDDQIVVPSSETLDITDEITLMAWIKPGPNLTADWRTIMGKAPTSVLGQNSFAYDFRTDQNGTLRYSLNLGGWQYVLGPQLTEDTWYHVAGTYDGAELILYVDGAPVGTTQAAGTIEVVADPLCVGNIVNAAGTVQNEYWSGVIDEVRIWDRALGESEVAANMEQGREGVVGTVVQAYGPTPRDGSMIEETLVLLQWRPGDLAGSHRVYFAESFDDVNEGLVEPVTTTEESLRIGFEPPYPMGLTPGQTYYWRVDEVNDAHPESPWKGVVWSFSLRPAVAWNPSPADGTPFVDPEQELSWEIGLATLFHTIYFGESFDEVNDAVAGGWMIAEAVHAPGPLAPGTTYYWRVDEFDGMTTHKGDVWSFTTIPDVPVHAAPNFLVWWTFDEGAGTNAVDWSGHGNHGTVSGAAQWTPEGYHGGALEFNRGGRVIRSFPEETWSAYTVALWAKASVLGQVQWSSVFNNNSTGSDFQIDVDGTQPGSYRLNGVGGNELMGPVTTDWVHLAASCDGTDTTLWYNGRQAGTVAIANTVFGRFAAGINRGNNQYFAGLIDDVRVYDRTLSEAEIAEVMRGNPLLPGAPEPAPGAIVDVRDITALRWLAGDTAASHDVYFGTDRTAVAAADNNAAEFRGNQPGTSFPLAGLVEFGGGDYFWRIDEVEADGTVQTGYVWKFTVPDYLVVDDFESYNTEVGSRVFEKWIDGIGFTQPEPGHPGNGTGAAVGHDIWSVNSPYLDGNIMETANVHAGGQAMPLYYDNTFAPAVSEADRTFTPGQNWTLEGITTLVVHFRGEAENTGDLYVKINGVKVPYGGDPGDIASGDWIAWEIDLASVGANVANVTTLTIGVEGGQTGLLYIDDIILTRP